MNLVPSMSENQTSAQERSTAQVLSALFITPRSANEVLKAGASCNEVSDDPDPCMPHRPAATDARKLLSALRSAGTRHFDKDAKSISRSIDLCLPKFFASTRGYRYPESTPRHARQRSLGGPSEQIVMQPFQCMIAIFCMRPIHSSNFFRALLRAHRNLAACVERFFAVLLARCRGQARAGQVKSRASNTLRRCSPQTIGNAHCFSMGLALGRTAREPPDLARISHASRTSTRYDNDQPRNSDLSSRQRRNGRARSR